MTPEEMKRIARRIPLEAINQKKLAVIDEVVSPRAVDHSVQPGMPETFDSTKKLMAGLLSAFPDLHYTIDNEVAEGNEVAQYLTGEGTMTGQLMDFPATGRHARWNEIHISRFQGNTIAEHWANIDQMGMLQQLGLIPAQQSGS